MAVLLSLATCAHAGSSTDATVAAVLAAHEARNAALVGHDLVALESLLAPDFNYTHSNNLQETKASHLGSLRDGLRYTRYETSELRVNVLTPDVVTVNGIFDQIKGRNGDLKAGSYLFLAVWRRAGDTWQLVSFQSALPPPAAPKV